MARPLRIEYPRALYHITSRGNAWIDIFYDKKDREFFLELLEDLHTRFGFLIYAYCLMSNHYHLLIETPHANLVDGMRRLNGLYTQRFNKRHKRIGHLLQGRYKAFVIEKESYLLEVCRYIVLNPLQAGLVKHIGEWQWSSYRSTAGLEPEKDFLAIDSLLSLFSEKKMTARKQYVQFVKSGLQMDNPLLNAHGGIILGSDKFARKIMKRVRNENFEEVIKKERDVGRPKLETILARKKRESEIVEAVIKWNYKQKEVADYLGLHYSTISKIVKNHSRFKN